MDNQSDIKNSIIRHFSNFDSAGKSGKKIDTVLEYELLGEYLNGSCPELEAEFPNISESDRAELEKIYANLKGKFAEYYNKGGELPVINDENAAKYADLYSNLQHHNEKDKYSNFLKKLQTVFNQFLLNNGEDVDSSNIDYNFSVKLVAKGLNINKENQTLAEESLKFLEKPYNRKILKKSVKKYIKEHPVQNKIETKDIDLGNGKFDKNATQKTNVCWALAGINALMTTKEGQKLLETNIYFDENTGIYGIHFEEAEKNGLHDGVYIITPEDLSEYGNKLSSGEGDANAVLIALDKYFEEVRNNPELTSKMEASKSSVRNLEVGNYGFRLFEILTGGKAAQYSDFRAIMYKEQVQNGIGNGAPACISYEDLFDSIKNARGVFVLSIAGHAISVVGTRDNNLLVQESNNDVKFADEYSKRQTKEQIFKPSGTLNGAPVYELNKENYEVYIEASSFLKW